MLIKILPVGHLETNCYIVTDESSLCCAVIDPGDESNTILDYVESNNLSVKAIMITHGHHDHTLAAEAVCEATGAPIYIGKGDSGDSGSDNFYTYYTDCPFKFYKEGDVITVGALSFHVMETPGHSPGSVTLRCEEALFVGDALFRDSCGRTDLPGGSMEILAKSLRRLAELPGDYEVYPGHLDATTLDRERRFNYYVQYAMQKI